MSLIRKRAQVIGDVEAPNREAAEAAAVPLSVEALMLPNVGRRKGFTGRLTDHLPVQNAGGARRVFPLSID
jgi:hypothetical protein